MCANIYHTHLLHRLYRIAKELNDASTCILMCGCVHAHIYMGESDDADRRDDNMYSLRLKNHVVLSLS
jgi:hypothetical protein